MPSTVEPQALFITPANSSGARLLRVSLRASSQTDAGSDPSAGQWQMKRGERVAAVKISAAFTPLRKFGYRKYRNRKSVPLKRTNLLLSPIASAAAALLRKAFDGDTKWESLRERAATGRKFAQCIARKEVKKPSVSSGSFGCFSSCWEKQPVGDRPRARKQRPQRPFLKNEKGTAFAVPPSYAGIYQV